MTKIRYLGHAAFEISNDSIIVYIDPFLENSPISVSDIKKANFVLISHDHSDHIGAAEEIANKTGATIISTPEVSSDFNVENKLSMNMGSMIEPIDGFKVAMVQAIHTSSKGTPVGYVIEVGNVSIYHGGDTALFGDMSLIKKLYRPKIALLPIGGHYVMGSKEAAVALTLIEPEIVIPMHYGTFPVLEQDPKKFLAEAEKIAPSVKVKLLKPGESLVCS
jgi:L-ascorbate metabolism protein UlaG (beta-lactamase superfamily)